MMSAYERRDRRALCCAGERRRYKEAVKEARRCERYMRVSAKMSIARAAPVRAACHATLFTTLLFTPCYYAAITLRFRCHKICHAMRAITLFMLTRHASAAVPRVEAIYAART